MRIPKFNNIDQRRPAIRYEFFRGTLATLRARLFSAALTPALIGGAYAARRNVFEDESFALIIIGLACAQLAVLLISDYINFKNFPEKEPDYYILPGSPVFGSPDVKPKLTAALAAISSIFALTILAWFSIKAGTGVLILGAAGVALGALYIFNPFRGAYFSAALISPFVGSGVYMAMTGISLGWAYLAPAPLVWIAAAELLTHREVYRGGRFRSSLTNTVLFLYFMAFLNINIFYYAGLYSYYSLFVSLVLLMAVFYLLRIFRFERRDPVPAVALGAIVYSVVGVLLAMTILS
ncbi:MAG: hypothetical protein ACLFQX_13055 [Candidatus Kapaibacterium sp.]